MKMSELWKHSVQNTLLAASLFAVLLAALFGIEQLPAFNGKLLDFADASFCIGIVASVIGVGYTLTIRNPQNYTGFYFGIAMSLLLSVQFFLKGIYDLTFLYIVVFIPFQILSILAWKNPTQSENSAPSFLANKPRLISILVFFSIVVIDYLIATYVLNNDTICTNVTAKIINGVVIASSILANYWLIYKKTDAWIYWILYSAIGTVQGIVVLHHAFNTILFLFFLIINSLAAISWIKK